MNKILKNGTIFVLTIMLPFTVLTACNDGKGGDGTTPGGNPPTQQTTPTPTPDPAPVPVPKKKSTTPTKKSAKSINELLGTALEAQIQKEEAASVPTQTDETAEKIEEANEAQHEVKRALITIAQENKGNFNNLFICGSS